MNGSQVSGFGFRGSGEEGDAQSFAIRRRP